MPEYLSPGVYVEEVASGPRPIEGVSTSTSGFVGVTERGPEIVQLVTSWSEYVRWYGGFPGVDTSFFPYGVKGFFDNGGQRAFIARITGPGAGTASVPLPTQGTAMTMEAIGAGAWGNSLLVRVSIASQSGLSPDLFRVMVLYYADGVPSPFIDPTNPANLSNPLRLEPSALEDFDNLSPNATATNYFLSTINSRSRLVHIPDAAPQRPNNLAFPVTANHDFPTGNADTNLHLIAGSPGAPMLTVEIVAGALPNTSRLNVVRTEDFDDLLPAAVLAAINSGSRLVSASWFQVNPPKPIVPTAPNVLAATRLAGPLNLATANAD